MRYLICGKVWLFTPQMLHKAKEKESLCGRLWSLFLVPVSSQFSIVEKQTKKQEMPTLRNSDISFLCFKLSTEECVHLLERVSSFLHNIILPRCRKWCYYFPCSDAGRRRKCVGCGPTVKGIPLGRLIHIYIYTGRNRTTMGETRQSWRRKKQMLSVLLQGNPIAQYSY